MICITKGNLTKNGKEGVYPKPARQGGGQTGQRLSGLTTAQAEASRRDHGHNGLTERKAKGFWQHFLSNLNDPVIRILLAALLLNLLLTFRQSDWVETVGIAFSILLATTISTVSQVGSEAAFARLRAESARTSCRVLRDGNACVLPMERIVVGDVVLLSAGDQVPADGVLVQGRLTLDQAAMTGESREVVKWAGGTDTGEPGDEASLFRGCAVVGGEGRLLVRRVGDRTLLGEISREVQEETRDSPLKIRLSKLARQISVLGYVAAMLVAAAFLFHAFVIDSGFRPEILQIKLGDWSFVVNTLLEALMLGLTVVVVAVPEGLPMMIAVVLSANIRRMVRDRVLVRKPAGIEAAGSMDLLFTDKTGTLTDGKLTLGQILAVEGDYPDVAAFCRSGKERFARYLLSCHCNTGATTGRASTFDEGDPWRRTSKERSMRTDKAIGDKRVVIGGNATDRALLTSVLTHACPDADLLYRLPFDSARKYSASTVRVEGRTLSLIKGAPEKLLACMDRALDGAGRTVLLDRSHMAERIRRQTTAGERVLLLGVCEGALDAAALERGVLPPMTLLCALTLADRIRPEAYAAVESLHGAGVQVVMITGDAPETAARIASTCGILDDRTDLVLTGAELSTLTDGQLKERLPRLAVVARALPSDKSRLVRVAQQQERVVGMTGDGINDAPALRLADIGFAMGSGAPVAQDAGDILILDDNLASIVRAVLYGRNIFKSIRKFIALQLTMNFCAVGISMIGPFIGVDAPVTVVQMLWINLIMDTLGGLAFAGEAALPSCLKERPKRRDEPILCGYMMHEILLLGGYTVGLCVLFLKHPSIRAVFRTTPDQLCHLTAFFALFIFASVFNCFNARSDRLRPFAGLSKNRLFLVIMGAILAVQVGFVYLGGSVLRTMPLTARELGVTALLAASVLPAELARKLLWRLTGGNKKGKY